MNKDRKLRRKVRKNLNRPIPKCTLWRGIIRVNLNREVRS